MHQNEIWEYYQNEYPESFAGSYPRHKHLAQMVHGAEKVLNIGVGAGIFEDLALARGVDIHALDPVERSILTLRDRLKLGDKAQTGYSQAIPFADAAFDVVVASEVLEHLLDDVLTASIKEIARVLRPGGRFIGTVPARENLAEQIVVCPHCGERFHRWGHHQSFDPDRIRQILASRFEVQSLIERPFLDWAGRNWKGRLAVTTKMGLWRLGIHGTDETIVFVAARR